jgi:hypothetical protein
VSLPDYLPTPSMYLPTLCPCTCLYTCTLIVLHFKYDHTEHVSAPNIAPWSETSLSLRLSSLALLPAFTPWHRQQLAPVLSHPLANLLLSIRNLPLVVPRVLRNIKAIHMALLSRPPQLPLSLACKSSKPHYGRPDDCSRRRISMLMFGWWRSVS